MKYDYLKMNFKLWTLTPLFHLCSCVYDLRMIGIWKRYCSTYICAKKTKNLHRFIKSGFFFQKSWEMLQKSRWNHSTKNNFTFIRTICWIEANQVTVSQVSSLLPLYFICPVELPYRSLTNSAQQQEEAQSANSGE